MVRFGYGVLFGKYRSGNRQNGMSTFPKATSECRNNQERKAPKISHGNNDVKFKWRLSVVRAVFCRRSNPCPAGRICGISLADISALNTQYSVSDEDLEDVACEDCVVGRSFNDGDPVGAIGFLRMSFEEVELRGILHRRGLSRPVVSPDFRPLSLVFS